LVFVDSIAHHLKETGEAPSLKRLPICISLVVWGEWFVDFFLEFCLPSFFAAGNFPAISHRFGSTFILHTSANDADRIRASAPYYAACAILKVDVRVVEIGDLPPHERLSRCHSDAIRTADSLAQPIVFLSPDTVWSNNAFKAIDRAISARKRVLFIPNVRAVREDSIGVLKKLRHDGGCIDVDPRVLTGIGIRHLHPTTRESMVPFGCSQRLLPTALLWPNAKGDLLGHFFHLHPLMVFPKRRFAKFDQTIDGDLVQSACPDPADHQVIVDSDEATCVEFSPLSHFIGGIVEKEDARGVMSWAMLGANAVHWSLFPHRVRLHANPIYESDWVDVERRATAFVSDVHRLKPRRRIEFFIKNGASLLIGNWSGVSRAELNEWIFRRRHVVQFAIRNAAFRSRHAISYSILSVRRHFKNITKRTILALTAKLLGTSKEQAREWLLMRLRRPGSPIAAIDDDQRRDEDDGFHSRYCRTGMRHDRAKMLES
jgi:hypothetical protein